MEALRGLFIINQHLYWPRHTTSESQGAHNLSELSKTFSSGELWLNSHWIWMTKKSLRTVSLLLFGAGEDKKLWQSALHLDINNERYCFSSFQMLAWHQWRALGQISPSSALRGRTHSLRTPSNYKPSPHVSLKCSQIISADVALWMGSREARPAHAEIEREAWAREGGSWWVIISNAATERPRCRARRD